MDIFSTEHRPVIQERQLTDYSLSELGITYSVLLAMQCNRIIISSSQVATRLSVSGCPDGVSIEYGSQYICTCSEDIKELLRTGNVKIWTPSVISALYKDPSYDYLESYMLTDNQLYPAPSRVTLGYPSEFRSQVKQYKRIPRIEMKLKVMDREREEFMTVDTCECHVRSMFAYTF